MFKIIVGRYTDTVTGDHLYRAITDDLQNKGKIESQFWSLCRMRTALQSARFDGYRKYDLSEETELMLSKAAKANNEPAMQEFLGCVFEGSLK